MHACEVSYGLMILHLTQDIHARDRSRWKSLSIFNSALNITINYLTIDFMRFVFQFPAHRGDRLLDYVYRPTYFSKPNARCWHEDFVTKLAMFAIGVFNKHQGP